jgi:hypothetical protein
VTAVVHVDGIDRVAADRTAELARELARGSAHGAVDITTAHDAVAARLTLTATGRLPAVLRLLNGKSASGARLVEDRVGTSLAASVDGVDTAKAIAIGDHLLNAAKNHPPGDPRLEVRTAHDERRAKLQVTLNGSLFATSYLLFLVNLHLTQSRT